MIYLFLCGIICGAYAHSSNASDHGYELEIKVINYQAIELAAMPKKSCNDAVEKFSKPSSPIKLSSSSPAGETSPLLSDDARRRALYKKYKTREKYLLAAYAVGATAQFVAGAYCGGGGNEEACFRQGWAVPAAGGALTLAWVASLLAMDHGGYPNNLDLRSRCELRGKWKSLIPRFFASCSMTCLPFGLLAGGAGIKIMGSSILMISPLFFAFDYARGRDEHIRDIDTVLKCIGS